MKHRDPFANWLLIILTLGQYAFVWTFFLARDANVLAGAEYIRVRKHALIFACLWGFYIIGLVITALIPIGSLAASQPYVMVVLLPVALTLLGYFFWMLFSVAVVLRREGIPNIPSDGALFFYSLLYMSSLPLLQSRLNKRPNRLPQPSRSKPAAADKLRGIGPSANECRQRYPRSSS